MKELFNFLGSLVGTVAKEMLTKSRTERYEALTPLKKKIQNTFVGILACVILLFWIVGLYSTYK